MSFTSFTFLLFLIVVLGIHWSLPSTAARNRLLVAASLVFYGWWDYRFCSLIILSALVDYSIGLLMQRHDTRRARGLLLSVSCVCNLGVLGFFKYFGFFTDSFVALAGLLGVPLSPSSVSIILPIGISFYTFQTMGYTIDVYRRKIQPTANIVDYLAYVTFFPQLVAGPIERAGRLLPQFSSARSFDIDRAVEGMRQMLWGFFKKMVLADNLAIVVDQCYANPDVFSAPAMAIATVFFAFQIYYDFSGYSDIAIGTAKLFGVNLMRNFAYPFFSQSVGEFWRRWHISLSTWFRDYVFIPLGGSRGSRGALAMSMAATFSLSGLWHGAAWHFILWGAANGLMVLHSHLTTAHDDERRIRVTDLAGGVGVVPSMKTALRIIRTFCLVGITWVFFRAGSVGEALLILKKIFLGWSGQGVAEAIIWPQPPLLLVSLVAGTTMVEWWQRGREHPLTLDGTPTWFRWFVYSTLIWGTFCLIPPAVGAFIYFQF